MSVEIRTKLFSIPADHPGVGIIFDWIGGEPDRAIEKYLLLGEGEKVTMLMVFPKEEIDMFAFFLSLEEIS